MNINNLIFLLLMAFIWVLVPANIRGQDICEFDPLACNFIIPEESGDFTTTFQNPCSPGEEISISGTASVNIQSKQNDLEIVQIRLHGKGTNNSGQEVIVNETANVKLKLPPVGSSAIQLIESARLNIIYPGNTPDSNLKLLFHVLLAPDGTIKISKLELGGCLG